MRLSPDEILERCSRERMTEICEGLLGMAVWDEDTDLDLAEAIADSMTAGDVTEGDL